VVPQTKTSVIVWIALIAVLTLSCSRRNKSITMINVAGALPVLHGENITSLISDSGVTRFRLETKVWDAYASDTAPYWYFPEGLYVEQFDSLFQVSGYVKADTAYYFERTGLWRLLHNVLIKNAEGTTCKTSELFWNQKEPASSLQSIYSDKFVEITTPDEVITAIGFKSNQSLTKYTLYQTTLETEIADGSSTEKETKSVRVESADK
jgi:LPS export ABC transporter protein LptC